MIVIECTQEMADRWDAHLKYIASLRGAVGWNQITPEKAKKVLEQYNVCGSKRKVARDLHLSPVTVGKVIDAQGVPA